MIRLLRDFRLVPVVLIAIGCLFALKIDRADLRRRLHARRLANDGRHHRHASQQRAAGDAPAPPRHGTAGAAAASGPGRRRCSTIPDVTGSVAAKPAGKPEPKAKAQAEPSRRIRRRARPADARCRSTAAASCRRPSARCSNACRSAATSSTRARRELEMRESLLKAAEKRLEARLGELKELEARINDAVRSQGRGRSRALQEPRHHVREHEAEGRRQDLRPARHRILIEVATPDQSAPDVRILAQMAPEAAERLTVELADAGAKDRPPAELPKIEGQPTTN